MPHAHDASLRITRSVIGNDPDRPAVKEGPNILQSLTKIVPVILFGDVADMRRQNHIIELHDCVVPLSTAV